MQDVTWWAWLLGGSSIILALTAAALSMRLNRSANSDTSTDTQPKKPAPLPTAQTDNREAQRATRVRIAAKALRQSWFVVFDAPSNETDQRLAQLLTDHGAFFDAQLGVFYITSQHSTYQLTLAHSASPGTLPALHLGKRQPDGSPLAGVSVLIKFISKQSVARHPGTFIDVMLAAQRIGGRILNSDHQPMTPEDFTALFDDMQRERQCSTGD